jgi:hypothetical protein
MPARITHNEGTINGSKEHTYIEFILVGGGNTFCGGQTVRNFGRIKSKTRVKILVGAGSLKGCKSSITWESTNNQFITSDYGFEYLKDSDWHNDIVIAKGGEESLVRDSFWVGQVHGDNKNKPGCCAIKMLTIDYNSATNIKGSPEVNTDGDYTILVWKQSGTIEAA